MTLLFFTSLIYVGLKSYQQQNVIFRRFWSVIPVSYMMGFGDVFIIRTVAHGDSLLLAGIVLGTGGWIGCWASMWLHYKVHVKK